MTCIAHEIDSGELSLLEYAAHQSRLRLAGSHLAALQPGEAVADLFCGAGGWGEGARESGIRVDFAVNHWGVAIDTHKLNNPGCVHHKGDAWRVRPRNVVIIQRDAFGIIDRFEDDPATAIYADPPYPSETRSNMGENNGGGGRYMHEFGHNASGLFGAEDEHAKLARMLRGYKSARIVVSTYDCPRYRDLYKGWTFVDCTMLKLLHQQNGRGARAKEAPEVLIVNGPSYTEGAS